MVKGNALVTLVATAWAAHASALSLVLFHSDGEFVDRGTVTAQVTASGAVRLDCAAGAVVARNGNGIEITVVAAPPSPAPTASDCNVVPVALGRFAAGTYQVSARLLASEASETATQGMVVLPLDGRCNAEPALQPALYVAPPGTASELAQRVASDPAYAASLGNPVVRAGLSAGDRLAYLTYPPLVDPTVMSVRLHELQEFQAVYRNGYACLSAPPPDRVETFEEFHHQGLDEYFYTADPSEIAAIDRGDVGPWTRTGSRFTAVTFRGCPFSSPDTVVYRFAGKPGVGSHFFTRDRAECSTVDRGARWDFEGIPFYAAPVQPDGSCAALHAPLYRVWRPFGASNHRFTTDADVASAMVARGWVAEGAAMCVRTGS